MWQKKIGWAIRNDNDTKKVLNLKLKCGSVGIVACYWLSGLGIESRLKRDFPHPSRAAQGPNQSPCTMSNGFLSRGKASVAWGQPSSAEVKEKVELCFYSPSGPSWNVLGQTSSLYFLPEGKRRRSMRKNKW